MTKTKQSFTPKISVRNYRSEDTQELASIYFNTIHQINSKHYTPEQVNAWAPQSSLQPAGWAKKFIRTNPIIAVSGETIVGFAEFEPNGHIDCFYIHHEWIGKGAGSALIREIFARAKNLNIPCVFVEASITAKPFFERHGFLVLSEQTVVLNGIGLTNYKMERKICL